MGLRKPEVREPDELREDGADRRVVDAAVTCPVTELAPHPQHRVATALAAHGPAKSLGLAGREPRQSHRDLQDLLLEHHHPERVAKAVGKQRMVVRRLEVGVGPPGPAVADVRVHGAAAHGPRPDQRDLDGEVVEVLGPGLQDALDLRAALDLEDADGVARPDLVVDDRVVHVDARQVDGDAAGPGDEVDALLHGRQHPEAEQVDLHEPRVGAGVLVPLAHLAAGKRRRHDRNELHEGSCGHDHPPRVL